MRQAIRRILERILQTRGTTLSKVADLDRDRRFTLALLAESSTAGGDVASVVFSKDRAMQLHAFLTSYIEQVRSAPGMTVLFKASTPDHAAAYAQLQAEFEPAGVRFMAESSFRDQLIAFVQHCGCDKVLLFVDDMVFKEPLDGDVLRAIDTAASILSLTRGRDLVYSMVLEKPITPPPFRAEGDGMLSFSWNGPEFSDWTFPLGLSGFMYGRVELLAMLKTLAFKAPNSLEAAMQDLRPYYLPRPGLCFDKAVCACVHANMVQTELSNPTIGTFSIEELLRLWAEGKAIDVRAFYGLDLQAAERATYQFRSRTAAPA